MRLFLVSALFFFSMLQSGILRAEFRVLHSYNGADGMDAYNQVVVHNNVLFSTAVRGGQFGKGTLISLDLRSSGAEVLHHFNGPDGRSPFNLTAVQDNKLWGVTRSDEVHYKGTLFHFDLETRETTLAHQFRGAPLEPDHTLYGPLSMGAQLYGMSNLGGAHNQGALYRFDPSTQAIELLHSFEVGAGTRPFAGLLEHDGWLLGTASDITLRTATDPPNDSFGVIFKIRPDGSDFQIVHRFEGGVMGAHPYGNLVPDSNGWLYGTTLGEYNNIDDQGVVFRINSQFNQFQVLHDFSARSDDGSKPNGDLTLSADGKTLFGFAHGTATAPLGAESPFFGNNIEAGTLFSMDIDGQNFRVLHRFDSPENGLVPERTPVLYENTLYGAAAGGGVHSSAERPDGMGMIFSYSLAGKEVQQAEPSDSPGAGSVGLVNLCLLCLVFFRKLSMSNRGYACVGPSRRGRWAASAPSSRLYQVL